MDCLYLFIKNEFFPNRNVRSEETLSLFLILFFKIESASKYFFCKIKFSIILFSCEKEKLTIKQKNISKYFFKCNYFE